MLWCTWRLQGVGLDRHGIFGDGLPDPTAQSVRTAEASSAKCALVGSVVVITLQARTLKGEKRVVLARTRPGLVPRLTSAPA